MAQTYTGTVKEVGGVELGKSGNEKPRKIVISDSPDYQGKTFRIWGNDSDFGVLSQSLGQTVTVEYEPEEVQMGDKKWTSNKIVGVHQNGDGGGERTGVRGEVTSAPQPSPAPDWSVPVNPQPEAVSQPQVTASKPPPPEVWNETKATIANKDDYWEQRSIMDQHRSLEMEAAWAVKASLDRVPVGQEIPHEKLVENAVRIAILKRQVASELSE